MSSVRRFGIVVCSALLFAGCNASLVQLSQATSVPLGAVQEATSGALLYLSDVATNNVYVYSPRKVG
jgi:hypothetical protein